MKTLSRIAIFLLVFTTAQLTAHVRDGFYIGVGFGDAIDKYKQKVAGALSTPRVNETLDHLIGNAFVGFGHTLCRYYIAGEVGTYFPERTIINERPGAVFDSFFTTKTSVRDYVTADVLLGARPCECLLFYFRGGVSYAKVAFFQFSNLTTETPSRDFRKRGAAGRVGVGINYAITSCFGIGLDYIYTSYPRLHFTTETPADFKIAAHSNFVGISGIFSF